MRLLTLLCLALLMPLRLSWAARPDAATVKPPVRVAVFAEVGFPYINVNPLVAPRQIAEELRASGIPVDLLDTDSLADAKKFNAESYGAVVLPYGNAYPAAAFYNLKRFHHAGGSLITTGIPFTHAMTRELKKGVTRFVDQKHNAAPALWGPQGIGMGGFSGGETENQPLSTLAAPGDPFHLAKMLSAATERYSGAQWFDPGTLPSGVTMIPVLGDAAHPFAALIVHKSDAFAGAVDAWTYMAPLGDREDYDERQMIERGTIAALAMRGMLTAGQANTAFAYLDAQPAPFVYANLVLPTVKREYPTFQPKMPPLAPHLYVADLRKSSFDERLLLISLQGIVNQKQPRMYLLIDDNDAPWISVLQQQKETGTPVPVKRPLDLVRIFRSEVKGAVVCDPKVYESPCIAASLAGVDNLLVAMTPQIAAQAGLPIKADLRGRFKDDSDALHFLRTQLAPRLNPYLSCSLDPACYDKGGLDGVIAAHGSCFWITGPLVQNRPGANAAGELKELRAFFASLPLGTVVRGFWWHGAGMGLEEQNGVALGSRFGKITLVSDLISNVSVHSGVRQKALVQKPRPPAPPLDRSKIYLCFTMSDGDNLCTWRGYFRKYFDDPLRGTIPIGWGMGPSIIDIAPDWARWYYARATPNDEFICDVSGVAYMYPPSWGTALKDRNAALHYFYGETNTYMARMDMKTVRLMNVAASDIAQVGPLLPDVHFLMPDYGIQGETGYSRFTYTLPATGQPVFRAVCFGNGPEHLADQIRAAVSGAPHPAFVNAFVRNWGSSLSDLKKTLDLLGPDYVAVTPSQLNTLYREAQKTGPPSASIPLHP